MRETLNKFFGEGLNKSVTVMPIGAASWPTAIIVLGIVATPVWAVVMFWFLFQWLRWQVFH